MILVVGATGLLGHEITRLLTDQQLPVRALVREDSDQQKIDALKKMGAETVIADLKSPGTLSAACQGITKGHLYRFCYFFRSPWRQYFDRGSQWSA